MKTVTVQIGNSDDKLSQKEWASFVKEIAGAISASGADVHFFGCSQGDAPWQNASWVFNLESTSWLRQAVAQIRARWCQDSIGWTEGDTAFI